MHRKSLLITLVILLWLVPQLVLAESRVVPPLVILLADTDAVQATEGGLDLSESFVALVSGLSDQQRVAFISITDPTRVVGPVSPGSPDFNAVQGEIESLLSFSRPLNADDVFNGLFESYNRLSIDAASAGSEVYLLSGGEREADYEREFARLVPLMGRFQKQSWPVHTVVLPGASAGARRFSQDIAASSGGSTFELSAPDGYIVLAEHILNASARGSLIKLTEDELSLKELLTTTVDIAPGSSQATVVFFKEDPLGSLRLINPSGVEPFPGDRAASRIVETPHVVIWRLVDPLPGMWMIEARDVEGRISAWRHSANRYSLALDSSAPFPLNEPTVLTAYVVDGLDPVVLDGTRVHASVTTPQDATLVYEMKDDGKSGDQVAGDGLFSTTIPPIDEAGEYPVELELSWLDSDHRIASQTSFEIQPFPVIRVDPVEGEDLAVGERSKVATVFVHVQGEPYPVSPADLTSGLSSASGSEGLAEMVPQSLLGGDKAWTYDVYFTPAEDGLHGLVFWLGLDYSGRQYLHRSESIILPSVPPRVEAEVVAPPEVALEDPVPVDESGGFPTAVLWLVGVGIVILGAWGLYTLTRTRPYGFLYNDRDGQVADFTNLKRSPISRLLFRDRVAGDKLKVPGLEGVIFRFAKMGIVLKSRQATSSVRVDNEPLIARATIRDKTWIGVHGRLYSFLLSPPSVKTAEADD